MRWRRRQRSCKSLDGGGKAWIRSLPGLKLTARVKHGQVEYKSRKNTSFKQTDKEAADQKPSVGRDETLTSSDNTPCNEKSRKQIIRPNDLGESVGQRPLLVSEKLPAHLKQKVGGYFGGNVRTSRG